MSAFPMMMKSSEELILSEIKKLAEKKTVIMITHRLMNVVDADRIFVMDNGRISGSGTHADLLETNNVYRNLWNTQKELEDYGKGGVIA
ncbi:ATP-binding cassette, subfamily B/ATP-binding cassette, subfamily C [Butyrivibrio sp. INlla14]|nr:ATP-binding cassette, subfamily B/ATP-binding cassette, subfamily C [Butyrivibrio sp. INlla14]